MLMPAIYLTTIGHRLQFLGFHISQIHIDTGNLSRTWNFLGPLTKNITTSATTKGGSTEPGNMVSRNLLLLT